MKNIMVLSALTGVLALTGCTTLKSAVGNDMSGTHDVQATNNNTAPVASKNGVLVDATNQMTLYTYDKDAKNKSDCGTTCQVLWRQVTLKHRVNSLHSSVKMVNISGQ